MLRSDRIKVDPLEFVAKMLMYVPDKNSRRVMGYGVYSNRVLGERRKKTRNAVEGVGLSTAVAFYEPMTETDEFAKRRMHAWAKLIQRV